jgi:hypothetical protein
MGSSVEAAADHVGVAPALVNGDNDALDAIRRGRARGCGRGRGRPRRASPPGDSDNDAPDVIRRGRARGRGRGRVQAPNLLLRVQELAAAAAAPPAIAPPAAAAAAAAPPAGPPAGPPAAVDAADPPEGALFGCSKCRQSRKGCIQCRPWARDGHRGYHLGPMGECYRLLDDAAGKGKGKAKGPVLRRPAAAILIQPAAAT